MGLILRTTSTPNAGNTVTVKGSSLTFAEGDGNFAYLLTNMSGSNINITGSTAVLGTFTVNGRAVLNDLSGSLFGTSSWSRNALTASYILNAGSASYFSGSTGIASSILVSGSLIVTGSVSISGSLRANLSQSNNITNYVVFDTGSNQLHYITGSAGVSGTSGTSGAAGSSGTSGAAGAAGSSGTSGAAGAAGSSGTSGAAGAAGSSGTSGATGAAGSSGTSGTGFDTINNAGANRVILSDGSINAATASANLSYANNILSITGSTNITGSLTITTGSITSPSITGSLFGTSSWAISASWAPGGGGASFPYTGSAIVSGSLTVTGSTNFTTAIPKFYTVILNTSAGNLDAVTPISGAIGPNGENKAALEAAGWTFSCPATTTPARLTVGRPTGLQSKPLVNIQTHGISGSVAFTRPATGGTTGPGALAAVQTISSGLYTTLDLWNITLTNVAWNGTGPNIIVNFSTFE